jgi:hypothetical protein
MAGLFQCPIWGIAKVPWKEKKKEKKDKKEGGEAKQTRT